MIVTMKKVSVVILEKERKKALNRLRKSGVLHLESEAAGFGDQVDELSDLHSRASSAISKLDNSVKAVNADGVFNREEALKAVNEVLRIDGRIRDLYSSISKVAAQADMLKPYGEFEPADLAILRTQGVDIRLFDTDDSIIDELQAAGASLFILSRKKKKVLIAAVFSGDAPDDAVKISVELPEYGIVELHSLKENMLVELEDLGKQLADYSRQKPLLDHLLASLEQDLEFETLATGMEGEGQLNWISGFIPEDDMSVVSELASEEGWGLLFRDPDPGDTVPTLIKNGPRIRIIQPVFDFLGTLPGYREYDISLYFLAYFSVFFAMIVGDAGYGSLFFLTAVFLAVKSRISSGALPDAIKLLFVLSLATIAWGTITGNWFGSQFFASLPLLQRLTVPAIATFPDLFPGVEANPQETIMWLCFLLGLTHLILANVMNFIRDFPRLKIFSHLGWGSIIGGLYFLVLQLVIGSEMPQFALIMIAAGFVLVVLFGEQKSGISFFKGILMGVAGAFTTFLDAISSFSNIISYIRLFAVGMSSFYIASSFNNLASPMLEGWTIPFGIIIIAIGHGLNLTMALLSVVVHGIRLNMLEFSGQLGMEWTGIEYNPFRVRISEENNNNQGVPS